MGSDLPTAWFSAYEGLIGEALEAIAWLPIAVDTPHVVDALQHPSFYFSGGALIRFASATEIFLTWTQQPPHTLKVGSEREDWTPMALDRIRASSERPWGAVYGMQLEGVEFLTTDEVYERVVAARHVLRAEDSRHVLWICSGGPAFAGDGDDLWVGLDVEPPNLAELRPVGCTGTIVR